MVVRLDNNHSRKAHHGAVRLDTPSKRAAAKPVYISDGVLVAGFISRMAKLGLLTDALAEEHDSGVSVYLAACRLMRGQGRK